MHIKILAGLAMSVIAMSATPAFADGNWSHDYRGHGGYREHDRGRGYDNDRWYGHHEAYRVPRRTYGYAPRYPEPRYCPPRYYAPAAYYAPAYYAPAYVEPAYPGRWVDDLGVVVQLHLP